MDDVETARSMMRQHVGERIEEMLLHNANVFGEDAWVDALAEIAVQETSTVEKAIREPLESRLEAYETAVREFVDARIEVGLTTTPEARAAAMVRVEKAFARLRELVPPREGAPTEEDSRG